MKKWAALLQSNADILVFQLANFAYSPLLYFLLGSGRLNNSSDLLKTVYLIEVYLAVPAVIFYFNQRRISAQLEAAGKPLYDSIALAKLALSLLTALVLVFALKAVEPLMLPVLVACFFGNAITPHWLLSKHSYTLFTLVSLALRLVVLSSVLLGKSDYFLAAYTASLMAPGLYAYLYFRSHLPSASKTSVWSALASLVAPGTISLVRNFTASTLLFLVLAIVPANALAVYTVVERIIRSGFSFVVPYVLRANLRSGIRSQIPLSPLLIMAVMASYLYASRPETYWLLLFLAILVLALDLFAFIHSERAGSELASKTAYVLFFALTGLALTGFLQFYLLLLLLVVLPQMVKRTGSA